MSNKPSYHYSQHCTPSDLARTLVGIAGEEKNPDVGVGSTPQYEWHVAFLSIFNIPLEVNDRHELSRKEKCCNATNKC